MVKFLDDIVKHRTIFFEWVTLASLLACKIGPTEIDQLNVTFIDNEIVRSNVAVRYAHGGQDITDFLNPLLKPFLIVLARA